jgi:predicted dehydrogenase
MSQSRRVKAGVVGCGDISFRSYFPPVTRIFDLVATCDIIEDRARESARIWGAKEYYTNIDDMLAKSDVEVVFITTSMATHATLARKAAEAGRHFLVQKAFATDFDEAVAVVKATREAGVKGLAEVNYWQNPVYMKAKEILGEGHIGPVHYGLARNERGFIPGWGGPTFYEREGGGGLFDVGVYQVCEYTYLLGPAIRVSGLAKTAVPDRMAFSNDVFTNFLKSYKPGDDMSGWRAFHATPATEPRVVEAYDNTFTAIEWPDECLGFLSCNAVSFVLPPRGPRLFLCGEQGTLAINVPDTGSSLSVATLDKNSPYHVSNPRRGGAVEWYHFPGNAFPAYDYFAASTQHLYDCIVNDTEPLPSVEWGCHVAEILCRSDQSAETGRRMDLVTTF